MLDFDVLSGIAATVAAGVEPDMRHDTFQEAFLRFMRYSPRTRAGAYVMARSARDDLYRRQRTQRKLAALTVDDLRAAGWGPRHDPVEPGTYAWHLLRKRIVALYKRQAFPRWAAHTRRRDRERMRKWRAGKVAVSG